MMPRMLYVLDLVALVTFAVSYYRTCYRKGYRIDFWHAQLLIFCVVPYMLMLPFASNPLNALITGNDFYGVVASTPVVFAMTMAGFFALLLGGNLWRFHLGVGLRKTVARLVDVAPRCSMVLMSTRELLLFLTVVCLSMQLLILALYFKAEGFGFNLRAYTFEHPGVRPAVQIVALASMIVVAHCLARYMETKEKVLLASACLLLAGLLFFGQRGNIVYACLNVALCYIIQRRNTISLSRVLIGSSCAILLVFYLGSVRDGEYSPVAFVTSLLVLLFFGNNFSDLRDFAWTYSRWDQHLWLGKSYLAGLLAFVPRGISDFRESWTFGVATGKVVGLDTETHPGLKPGQFGECYFNFGLLGIILFGLAMGMLARRADDGVKSSFWEGGPSFMRAFSYTSVLMLANCLNTSLTLPSLYAFCGLFLLAWLYLKVRVLVFPARA